MTISPGWTEDRVLLLKKLWADGLSCSQIAGRLGRITRNAVIGKVHRLGLSGRATTLRMKSHIKRNPRKLRTYTIRNTRASTVVFQVPAEPLPAEDARPAQIVTFDALEDHHCRWIYGDVRDGDHGYCPNHRATGLSYCTHHARRVYQPPALAGRQAAGVKEKELESA
jgi:GcrA cell cycle regulator